VHEPWVQLKDIRLSRLLTQSDLANEHMTQSQLSLYEQGVLIPSEKTIVHLAARLGVDGDEWRRAWQPHRCVVEMRQRLWRAFIRRHDRELFQLLHEHPSQTLDDECYRIWLDTHLSVHPQDSSRLHMATQRVFTEYRLYIPRKMQHSGDIRLRIVLAMTQCNICRGAGRYRAATVWELMAQQLASQVPSYWM
jgi:transcriptional regulator with XRE-family HTH domain